MTAQSWRSVAESPRGLTRLTEQRIKDLLRPPATRLVGAPEHCLASPAQHVELQPFCWDTNGFYRRLGLAPGAPRIEVARAYMAMDGHRSTRLTRAAITLINRFTKVAYDRIPLGSFWMLDEDLDAGRLDGDLVAAEDDGWAYYVSDVPDDYVPGDELIAAVLATITLDVWNQGCPIPFAIGFSTEPRLQVVGRRIVAFAPLTIQEAIEYSHHVASQIVNLWRGAEESSVRHQLR